MQLTGGRDMHCLLVGKICQLCMMQLTAGGFIRSGLDKFAPAEMLTLRGTSGMTKELPEILRNEIRQSLDLLNRSNTLLSELAATVERSRNLLDESYRILTKTKVRSLFRDDYER